MYFKFLSGLILIFWLATTGLLIQMIYFPEESQFSEVPASQVINLFLSKNEHVDMDIFSGKELVGKIRVIPRKQEGGKIRLLKKGTIDVEIGNQSGKVSLISDLWLSEMGDIDSYSITLGMQELGLSCKLSQSAGDESVHYLVKQGSSTLLDSSDASTSLDKQFQAQLLLRAWGIDMAKIRQQVKAEAREDSVKMKARRGVITVEGTKLKGYVLIVKVLGDAEINFFFSEFGELLMIESFLDYRLVNYQLRVDPEAESLRDDGTGGIKVEVPEGTELSLPFFKPENNDQ